MHAQNSDDTPAPQTATPRVVLHVGFAKTATTMLQEQLFSRHPRIHNIGKPYDELAPSELIGAIRHVASADTIAYDPAGPAVGTILAAIEAGRREHRTVVLSDESLCHPRRNDPGLVARRLFEICPDAHILFTIREQRDLLVSHYLHDVRQAAADGYSHGFASWLYRERWLFAWADYHRTISFYVAVFGREKVSVLPFEVLATDPGAFAEGLADVLAVPREGVHDLLAAAPRVKRRLSRAQLGLQRFNALLVPGAARIALRPAYLPLFRLLARDPAGAKVRIPPRLVRKLQASLSEGNRRLEAEFDLPLARLGYMTSAQPAGAKQAATVTSPGPASALDP
jgi:hypothetical protein